MGGGIPEPEQDRVHELGPGDGPILCRVHPRVFDIDRERVRLTCNLFADHEARQREIENFWLRTVGLPRSCLCKSTINRYSRYSQKKRRNKLPYGTCRIVVHSTEIAQTIYGSIQELAGFDRPEWLDLR